MWVFHSSLRTKKSLQFEDKESAFLKITNSGVLLHEFKSADYTTSLVFVCNEMKSQMYNEEFITPIHFEQHLRCVHLEMGKAEVHPPPAA